MTAEAEPAFARKLQGMASGLRQTRLRPLPVERIPNPAVTANGARLHELGVAHAPPMYATVVAQTSYDLGLFGELLAPGACRHAR